MDWINQWFKELEWVKDGRLLWKRRYELSVVVGRRRERDLLRVGMGPK